MALTAVPVDEHSLYPWHEEDDVPQGSEHLDQCSYWKHALKRRHPAWRVE